MLPVLTRTAAARAARPVLPRIRPGITPPAALRKESTQANPPAKDLFTRFAKLDPELYGIMAVTLGAVGVFGYFVAGNPTRSSDARPVPAVPGSEPWREDGAHGKYLYYPGGDPHNAPREAPTALNVAVLPKVNLPKELHEKYNKYGKDGYDF